MFYGITIALSIISALLSIPVAILFVEVIASLNAVKPQALRAKGNSRKRVSVIVPAHNESAGVVPTISDIRPQLGAADRLIVVADNCSDDTAVMAAAAGAEVILRNDLSKIGKGYALGFGINHLGLDPPDFVVFVDADCRVQADMVTRLREVCDELNRPVQACFLMKTSQNSPIDHRFAEFAWIVKNWVRPLGLRYLDCPVQLMGTGMIFPWDVINSVPLASGNLVEDLKLGLDLAAIGKAPYFFPFVVGSSVFPLSSKGTASQRQRWVQGHLGMIARAPRLLVQAVITRNIDLLVLTLDLLVPPLSLLGLLISAFFALSCLNVFFDSSVAPVVIGGANLLLLALAIYFAWSKFGREVMPARVFLSIGSLIVKKIILYGKLLVGRTTTSWIRTDRKA